LVTRKRTIPYEGSIQGLLKSWTTFNGRLRGNVTVSRLSSTDIANSLKGTQVTESESHPGWRYHIRDRFTGDIGGNFTTTKRYVTGGTGSTHLKGDQAVPDGNVPPLTYNHAEYTGFILPCAADLIQFPPFINSSDDDLDEMGTTAIARCAPTNPTADLTTFLGEFITEGFPRMVGGAIGALRNAEESVAHKHVADEFLNWNFGWVPFIGDVKDLSKGIVHADRIIDQYTRDSGKLVRRRYGFPVEESHDTTVIATGVNPFYSPSSSVLYDLSLPASGKVVRTHYKYRRVWFSGGFTYYIPPRGGSQRDEMARQIILAKQTLGLRLTPDAVWNLAPWSWLIDWFSNAGDVLRNLSSWILDNQVLRYGYVMEHTISQYRYTFVGPTTFQSGSAVPVDVIATSESKIRRKATPYGFGVQYEGLSFLQKAILTALGISRWT
jgi:hypothetical protein